MQRPLALLALLQFVCIFTGFFALGMVLKLLGYPNNEEISPMAFFLRQKGLFLLFLPLAWIIYAATCFRIQRGLFSLPVATVSGVAICLFIILLFLWVSLYPL